MEPIDTDTPRTPGWWLNVLAQQLHDRRAGRRGSSQFSRRTIESTKIRPGLTLLEDYLAGDPPLREDIHSGWAAPFRQFLRMGRMNVAPLLVSSTTKRLNIRDFRTAAGDDDLGDVEARRLMRANGMRVKIRETHDNMCGYGDGYVMLTPPDATRAHTLITAESPLQCITAHDAATGVTLAALKMFRDEWDATDWAYLFVRGEGLYVARADVPTTTLFAGRQSFALSKQWRWDTDRFDSVPGGVVPVVRFRNQDGKSELEGYIDSLDRINDKLFNEWWIGKIQAFRQRALLLAPEGDDEDGFDDDLAEELEKIPDLTTMGQAELDHMFTTAPDGFWTLPIGAKLWESTPTDVRPLIESVKAELQWIAVTKSLPLHLITPDAANGSAEGASTMKEEHIFTIEDRADRADAGWAQVMAMAFGFQGDTARADVAQIEAIWAPFERFSLNQKTDAAQKVRGIVPDEVIMTDYLQMSPADVVERVRPLRARDLLYRAQGGPAAPAAPAVPAAT